MHPDFKDLLSEFNAHRVEYLVVGAHALAAHGHVRATKDMDVWILIQNKSAVGRPQDLADVDFLTKA
jgi:hypothetical protein